MAAPVRVSRLPWLVLGAGGLLSLLAAYGGAEAQGRQLALRFDREAEEAVQAIQNRLQDYADVLYGVRGLAEAEGRIGPESLRPYVTSLDLERRYPDLLGITWTQKVEARELPGFLARMRRGQEGFALRPVGERSEHHVVAFGMPEDRNREALGYDAASSALQFPTVARARDTGELAIAPPTVLAQGTGHPGILLRLALYRPGASLDGLEARRGYFLGTVNAVFHADVLAAHCLGPQLRTRLQVEAFDAATGAQVLPASGAFAARTWLLGQRLEAHRDLEVGSSTWRLTLRARPGYAAPAERAMPAVVLGTGLALTGLLAGLVGSLASTRRRARELAQSMTRSLREREARLRAITGLMPDLVMVLDEDGRYVEIPSADDSKLLEPRERRLGRRVDEVLPGPAAQALHGVVEEALRRGSSAVATYTLEHPEGTCWYEARGADLATEYEGRRCAVVVSRDITERQRTEEALRQSQKLESLGLLAGGIAHDFNNLLAAILGNLNLARMHAEEGRPVDPHLARMETAVQKAADLARQMLAYSGRAKLEREALDLNAVVRDMADLLRASLPKKLRLELELATDLPCFEGDRTQLQQVVLNLATNAAEAIGDREGRLVFRTGLHRLDAAERADLVGSRELEPGTYLRLEAEDDGCGMSPDVLSRIFDPFYTTKSTGKGLGLSAMLGILGAHGGGIRVRSGLGQGTRFILLFPASAEVPFPQARAQAPGVHPVLGGRVLLVEDEPAVRLVGRGMLERLGFDVVEAQDGREAIQCYDAAPGSFRLVMLDLTMPRMDGRETFLALRERDAALPVVLCSGFSQFDVPVPSAGRPVGAFLQKPYRYQEMRRAVEQALRP